MSVRNTIILLVVLIAVGTFFYFFEIRPEKPTADISKVMLEEVFEDLKVADVKGLEIKDTGTLSVTVLVRTGKEAWRIAAPVQEEAQGMRVEDLAVQLASLRSRQTFTQTTALSDYGLEKPSLEVRIDVGQRQEALQVGGTAPTGGYYYARKPSGDRVYMVDAYLIDDLKSLIKEPPVMPTPTPVLTATVTITQ